MHDPVQLQDKAAGFGREIREVAAYMRLKFKLAARSRVRIKQRYHVLLGAGRIHAQLQLMLALPGRHPAATGLVESAATFRAGLVWFA